MFVIIYRLEIYSKNDKSYLENFIEIVNEYAIAIHETSNVVIIVATTEMLQANDLGNIALKFFGKEGYALSKLGLLGPFKK